MYQYRLAAFVILMLYCMLIFTWSKTNHNGMETTGILSNNYSLNYLTSNRAINFSKVLVISRWREDISWIDVYLGDMNHIVYTKEDTLAVHNIPENKAQEATCYLRYIIDYYEKFPDIVVFLHAHRHSWHNQVADDIVNGLKALQWGKYEYMPLQTHFMTESRFRKNDTDPQFAFNHFLWTQVLRELGQPPDTIVCPCCASFAIKRQAILRRSKSFYENLYNFLQTTDESSSISSRTMEYTWHIIFGQPYIMKQFNMCDIFDCNILLLTNGTNMSQHV
jgi:hypothetical protein